MLISKVPDDGGKGECPPVDDNSHEYQTATELLDMMAKNQNFSASDGDALTPRDLVLLYKNIDLGTKLMTSAKDLTCVKTNQHVETVVYHDEPESDGSDISDVYSNEDLQNIFLVNKERLDLLNIPSSVENKLCHKFGDLEIQTTDDIDYNRHFLFQDPFIKEQLKSFNVLTNSKEIEASVLPASLLDYVCCKRLEDNYNFYMDNIIRYVKNTIEQLKRISNGDYLTDKAKEKWKEVEHAEDTSLTNTKVLATSTSIPLHVECKVGHQTSTWDDLVRSEVDIRSLSKILEKKIFVEVPKCISGSYKLLSKCCDDNLIISCQKEQPLEDSKKESRVDVVFKLKRSETGHVVSNISSIMFLETTPIAKVLEDARPEEVPLAVLYKEIPENNECIENNVKITELKEISEINDLQDTIDINEVNILQETCDANDDIDDNNDNFVNNDNNDNGENNDNDDFGNDRKVIEDNRHSFSSQPKENRRTVSFDTHLHMSDESEFRYHLCNNIDEVQIHTPKEASFQICPADLRMTMQKLTIQNALPEENVEDLSQTLPLKKKSPTRVRIKSPYENQSRAMEEKKRRKLLEIREKREKKKMALAESCKINKNKFGNRAPTPQASSSVTKLSITNKSFYNSIYGHSTDVDFKQAKNRSRRGENQKENLDVALENLENEEEMPSQELNSKKFINRSYYLDDAVTEMMYLTMKRKEEEKEMISASTSGVSGDFGTNLNILSQLISHSDIEANGEDNDEATETTAPMSQSGLSEIKTNPGTRTIESTPKTPDITPRALNVTESNKPKDPDSCEKKDPKKIKPSLECRKSIDKIYKLMNKIGKRQDSDNKSQNKYSGATSHGTDVTADKGSASIQGSDSGTSLKHHLTSSNPSTFSFDRNNNPENSAAFKRSDSPIITPKVIISSKSQMPVSKSEADKNKRDRNARVSSPQDPNPLKAISQLLHEFENVQRNRLKSGKEQKSARKDKADTNQPNTNTVNDGRINARQAAIKRRSRMEQHNEIVDRNTRANLAREKKIRQISGVEAPKIPYQQVPTDDRYIEKPNKKKINDILDEAKEARGEAVRGPSKFTSRLNSLAQPKRSYVQAHSAEYQNRYGRNLITDRLQRLVAAPAPPVPERITTSPNFRNRARRHGNDAVSAVSLKLPHQSSLPIDRPARTRHSTSNSPETKERVSAGIGPSFKPINVAETPETFQKMVEVESYVKNHYGRASSATITIEPFQPAKKSRAPLVPDNIDMGSISSSPSPQESTEAGSKLHRIIDFMLKNPTCGLEVLAECHEPKSKTPKDNNNDICFSTYRCEEGFSVDSDSITGTTDDELILRNKKSDALSLSGIDIEKFKHALCNTISGGTFSKRLRVKSLGLSPKTSIQQLFLLQAGDSGSLVLNATLPENSAQEKLLNLKKMPILSKSNLDWSFTNIPMQITTVGYAFPEYKTTRSGSQSLTQLLEKVSKSSSQKSSLACLKSSDKNPTSNKGVDNIVEKAHKDSQCYRGMHLQPLLEQDSTGDVPNDSNKAKICSKFVANTVCHNVDPKPRHDSNNDSKVEHPIVEHPIVEHPIVEHPIVEAEKSKTTDERQATNLDDKLESGLTSITPIGVENTTSFDVLVGLLNEIKKITTCQTHITKNEADECKELEFILNNTAQIENSNQSVAYNGISFTNLENLRCLESNPSVYSLYLSDNEDAEKRKEIDRDINPWYEIKYNISRPKPICVDKETAVNIPRKECVNRLTDVPSVFFPITINHSTDVTVSPLIAELCQTSTQSLFSYHSTYSEGLSKSMLEIPQALDIKDVDVTISPCEIYEVVTKTNVTKPVKRNTRYCGKDKAIIKEVKTPNNVTYSLNNTGFDPVMKMKRDLLVTIYSMLVFTVFAALSFPEVLFHV